MKAHNEEAELDRRLREDLRRLIEETERMEHLLGLDEDPPDEGELSEFGHLEQWLKSHGAKEDPYHGVHCDLDGD